MVNSPNCCTSLFRSDITLALTLSANCESSPIMSPMQYNNYVTLHRISAHMHCIGNDSADSTISVTPQNKKIFFWDLFAAYNSPSAQDPGVYQTLFLDYNEFVCARDGRRAIPPRQLWLPHHLRSPQQRLPSCSLVQYRGSFLWRNTLKLYDEIQDIAIISLPDLRSSLPIHDVNKFSISTLRSYSSVSVRPVMGESKTG